MLSVVILAKNEERHIKDCIQSVSFAGEIVVIDDLSVDDTRRIAKDFGAKVYKRSLDDDFAAQRNFGLEKASGEWVLFIDADERVTSNLKDEIVQVIDNPFIHKEGFYIKRKDFLWGKEIGYGEIGNTKLLRLAKKSSGKWKRKVHEQWNILGRTGTLKYALNHYPHPSFREFLKDVNRMSTLHAEANKKEGKKSNVLKIIFWPKGHFIVNWILRRGFVDGVHGFVVALVMSFHSFLAWSKLWMYQKDYKTD